MTTMPKTEPDPNKAEARYVGDAGAGTILAQADIDAAPEQVFRALTTDDVERWWGSDGLYWSTEWSADLRVNSPWHITVRWADGNIVNAYGEFIEIDPPHKIVHTRNFEPAHHLLGKRETTITYRLDPIATGTRVTVRDEGFAGRPEACYFNAEHWGVVLGWLAAHVNSSKAPSVVRE